MGKIGVMLVDDSAQTRDSLRRMLELEDDIQVVGEVSNADDAFLWAEALSPNVVIMDIRMDHINGLEAIRLLKERGFTGAVLVFSMYDEYLDEAIHVGASGYLVKGAKREELLSAIRRAPEGGFVFGSSIMKTDRGVAIALRYLTGQQVWASQLRRERTAIDGAVPEQSAQAPHTDGIIEGLLLESQKETSPTAEMTAEVEQTTGEPDTPDSNPPRNEEHPEGSSSTEGSETLQSEVELIFPSLQENGVVLDLYRWIKETPGAEIVEMGGSRSGPMMMRVDLSLLT